MQLVGSDCAVCHRGITFAPEAASCRTCAIAFHLTCLSAPSTCPTCGSNFTQLTVSRAQATTAGHAQAVAWGRKAALAVCLALFATQASLIGAALVGGTATPTHVVQFLISLVLIAALYFGYGWARVWLALSSGFGAVVAFSLAWTASRTGNLGNAFFLSSLVIIFAVSFGLLLFSSRVALFLASQRSGA